MGAPALKTPNVLSSARIKFSKSLTVRLLLLIHKNCVYGCIACEHVCPRKAIAFPQRITLKQRAQKDKGLLRKVKCRSCGKIFWTNEDTDLCFECRKLMEF